MPPSLKFAPNSPIPSIGAKTAEPLQFLKPLIDESWEHVAL